MLIQLQHVLGQQDLGKVSQLLRNARFVDGKLSAGEVASTVKNNLEIESNDSVVEKLNRIVMGNLVRHKTYQRAALPLHVASPFYARYEPGMEYGEHIDDPIMGQLQRYRSDIAITVFLNDPQEYEGGALIIHDSFGGERKIKYPAGDAVLYPASTRHRVEKVVKGTRVVAVTWIQSLVKDQDKRELLYQLGCAREKLLRKQPNEEHTKQVDLAYVNLVRRWSEV